LAANPSRRELLADTAIDVLATSGGHGLSHRAVDRTAGLPIGTTKNYHPTRDALLIAAAERVYQRYLDDQAELAAVGDPTGREQLAALLGELIRRGATTDRARLLALLELHAEATRHPALQELLAAQTQVDFGMYERLLRAAGLPEGQARARVFARCMQSALVSLLSHPKESLHHEGLDDLEAFVRGVLDAVYPA
jgi:DNA-binding transcriptional regulator YbjK